jgi:hypothetical protein
VLIAALTPSLCLLLRGGKPYRKRYGHPNNRTGIPNRIDINQRSDAVNNHHWLYFLTDNDRYSHGVA